MSRLRRICALFSAWRGGGANSKLTDAISMNKSTAGKLEKRIALLESRIQDEVKKAKQKVKAGQKQKALIHLKRKKMYEKIKLFWQFFEDLATT